MDSWGFLKDSWRILEGSLKNLRNFFGFFWIFFEVFVKDLQQIYGIFFSDVKMTPKWHKNWHQNDPKMTQTNDTKMTSKWPENDTKMTQKWHKNDIKMPRKWPKNDRQIIQNFVSFLCHFNVFSLPFLSHICVIFVSFSSQFLMGSCHVIFVWFSSQFLMGSFHLSCHFCVILRSFLSQLKVK